MRLENKHKNVKYQSLGECYCNLTRELDSFIPEQKTKLKHYILVDDWSLKNKCLPIRFPGGTIGGIWIDDNNVIKKIEVDTSYYIGKNYPSNINNILKKYIGEEVIIDANE